MGYSSAAVCTCAALGYVTMPPIADLLPGLTIGIQTIRRKTQRDTGRSSWEPENDDEVLFSEGSVPGTRAVDINTPESAARSRRLRFNLVCDPSYRAARTAARIAELPKIQINPKRKIRRYS